MEILSNSAFLCEGENKSRTLTLIIESGLLNGKNVSLSFVTPSGKCYSTPVLPVESENYDYLVPLSVLDMYGKLKAQIVLTDQNGYCLKSDIFYFDVRPAIDSRSEITPDGELLTLVTENLKIEEIKNEYVKKDGDKVLSDNNYSDTEKTKLAGIEANANNYTLPNATASVKGGIKLGFGLSAGEDGTANVTGAGLTVVGTYNTLTHTLILNDVPSYEELAEAFESRDAHVDAMITENLILYNAKLQFSCKEFSKIDVGEEPFVPYFQLVFTLPQASGDYERKFTAKVYSDGSVENDGISRIYFLTQDKLDSEMSDSSENGVKNSVIKEYADGISEALTTEAEAVKTRMTTVEGKVTSVEGKAAELEDEVADLNTEVQSYDGRISTAETNITALQGKVNTAETNITALQGKVNTAETNITALQGRITTAETNISNKIPKSDRNAANGVCPLDGSAKVPQANIYELRARVDLPTSPTEANKVDLDDLKESGIYIQRSNGGAKIGADGDLWDLHYPVRYAGFLEVITNSNSNPYVLQRYTCYDFDGMYFRTIYPNRSGGWSKWHKITYTNLDR